MALGREWGWIAEIRKCYRMKGSGNRKEGQCLEASLQEVASMVLHFSKLCGTTIEIHSPIPFLGATRTTYVTGKPPGSKTKVDRLQA